MLYSRLVVVCVIITWAAHCQAALVVTPPDTKKDEKFAAWKPDAEVKFELIGAGSCTIYSDLAAASIAVDLAKQTSVSFGKVKDVPGIFMVRIVHEYEGDNPRRNARGEVVPERDTYHWTIVAMPIDADAKTFALEIRNDSASVGKQPDRSVTLLGQFVDMFKDNRELRERALKDAWATYLESNKDGLAITAGTCATGVITAGAGFFLGLCLDRTKDHIAEVTFLFLKNCIKELRVPKSGESTLPRSSWDRLDALLDDIKAAWDMTNALKVLKKTATAGDAIEKAEFLKDFFMGSGSFDTTDKDSGVTLTLTLEQTTKTTGEGKAVAGYRLRWKLSKGQ